MNGAMPVAFMLLLLLIVFGAVAAIIWRSWIAGVVVLTVFVLVFGLYFVRVSAEQAPASMIAVREVTSTPIDHWEPDPEMMKNADVYSTMPEAARNLALRLCDQLQLSQPPVAPNRIHILSMPNDPNAQVVKAVFDDRFAGTTVVADNEHTTQPGELLVQLNTRDSDKKTKCLTFTPKMEGKILKPVDTCVKDAVWVTNLDEYRSTHTTGEWLVGWSRGMGETSQETAKQQAREDAARQMMSFVTGHFPQLRQPGVAPEWLHRQLVEEMGRRRIGKDEFVQAMQLPATSQKVYRAAVLVDVSSNSLERLRGTVVQESYRATTSIRRFSIGTVGMGVLICIVYLFLNWATRGYFQMNLRLGAFLVLIAGVLLLLLIG